MATTEFIRFVRLQESAKRLVETELQIAEIAYETGFQNPSYYSRRFQELFKQSPSEYRQEKQMTRPGG